MALVVQNADGDAAGANAYISRTYFVAYHADHGNDHAAYSNAQIDAAIIRATDYMDTRFAFRGVKLNVTGQTTELPRRASTCSDDPLTNSSGEELSGIPDAAEKACAEYSFRALSASLFQDAPAPEGGRLIDEHTVKVDVIEESTRFASSQAGSFALPAFPAADMLLVRSGLIESGRTLYR